MENGEKKGEAAKAPMAMDRCLAELVEDKSTGGSMHCSRCDLKWPHFSPVPDKCKADRYNRRLILGLGCEAKDGYCDSCRVRIHPEMPRPRCCIAMQKLNNGNNAMIDEVQKTELAEPRQKVTDGEIVAAIMQEMAATFKQRNTTYGSNYKQVPKLVEVLFTGGVPPELIMSDQWHLFELILVKLSRFAVSRLSHVDSIHDMAVYSAMIEMILTREERQK